LIRFEWGSGQNDEPTHKPVPAKPLSPATTISAPISDQPSPLSPLAFINDSPAPVPATDSALDDDEDLDIETISRLTAQAQSEAFHLVRSWPLSNGTGFTTPDLPYIHFFMSQMPNYLWFAGITAPVTQYIMAKARDQPVLQQAVLCTSAALLAEISRQKPSKYLEHKQKTLVLLQRHIDELEIDEGVAAAVFFLLFVEIGHEGARDHLRGLKSVLDFLKKKTQTNDPATLRKPMKDGFQNPDITGVSPLAWLIWAWGIRMDIGLATVDGSPMIAPLPAGAQSDVFHLSWISALSDPSIPNSAEWGLANFTLDNIMHRGVHVSHKAKLLRASPHYSFEDELRIQEMCQEIDHELELWRARPLIRQAELEESLNQMFSESVPAEHRFLHYPPLRIRNRMKSNLIMDYRTAKIYMSLVRFPEIGPGPPGQDRFAHSIEICRVLASIPIAERNDVRGAEEAMCLFLAGLTFGGPEYYPMETRWVQQMMMEYFPSKFGAGSEHILGIWVQNCPCVPMVKEKNFPWTIAESLGLPGANFQ
jgi:hypothetical protein